MSNIQGRAHPVATTERTDYIRIDVDAIGAITAVSVATTHVVGGLLMPQDVTVYWVDPGVAQRDLARALSVPLLGQLNGIIAALTNGANMADTGADPAPPELVSRVR